MMRPLRKLWKLARRCGAQGLVEYSLIFALVVLIILLARMGRMGEMVTRTTSNVSTQMTADRDDLPVDHQ